MQARLTTESKYLICCLQMLARPVHKDITDSSRQLAEALLADLKALLEAFPHNQPLACMKAKQVSHPVYSLTQCHTVHQDN